MVTPTTTATLVSHGTTTAGSELVPPVAVRQKAYRVSCFHIRVLFWTTLT